MNLFEKSIPEKEGIPSKCIIKFIEQLEKNDVNMHSLLMFRNNKLIFDGYYKPFDENTMHRMFSVTKSFVSAAIGILYGKNLIDINDPIIKYFPEYNNENVHNFLKAATIKDLLQMKSPHEKTAFKQIDDPDYVKAFFTVKPTKVPGTAFSYDTSASHTLCALVEKISGENLLDFLRNAFLDKIGFSKSAYCIKDPLGISLGGSGLMALPTDIALLAHVFLNNGRLWGKYEGIQVIPQNYISEACKKQSETFVKGASKEEKQGYGYQIWRISNNGYMFFGIGGQLAIVLPHLNFVMVTSADTLELQNGVNVIIDLFWKNVYSQISNNIYDVTVDFDRLAQIKTNLHIKAVSSQYKVNKADFSESYFVCQNKYGVEDLCVTVKDNVGKIMFKSKKGKFELPFGIRKNVVGKFPYYDYKCASSGDFFGENVFIVKSHIIDEEIGAVYFQFEFNELGQGVMLTKKNVGIGFDEFNFIYNISKTLSIEKR